MGDADNLLRFVIQHGDIDGVLGHQIGNELIAVDGVEIVGFLKGHTEEAAGHAVPEGGATAIVDHAAQFGQNAIGEAVAVHGNEQIAAACQQQAEPACAFSRVEEQTAHFGRTLQIGDQAEEFGPHGAIEFLAVLGQRVEAIAVEWPLLADLAEKLTGAAHLPGFSIFQHERKLVVAKFVGVARKGSIRPFKLLGQRCAIGRQIGETAAGQLGHLVEVFEVADMRGAQAKGHRWSPEDSLARTSALSAARSRSEGTIMNSSGE